MINLPLSKVKHQFSTLRQFSYVPWQVSLSKTSVERSSPTIQLESLKTRGTFMITNKTGGTTKVILILVMVVRMVGIISNSSSSNLGMRGETTQWTIQTTTWCLSSIISLWTTNHLTIRRTTSSHYFSMVKITTGQSPKWTNPCLLLSKILFTATTISSPM